MRKRDEPTIKGETVKKYLTLYSDMPSLTMAKKVFKEHPLIFSNIEEARTVVRYYRGAMGEIARKQQTGSQFLTDYKNPNFAPFKIPDSPTQDYQPYKLPKERNRIGLFSDFHIPNHRIEPIEIALKFFDEKKVNTIIINGDLLDNTPFTHFVVESPTPDNVRDWFDMTEYFLEGLRNRFPDALIIWTEGNHDAWYKRWMWSHAAQLDKDPYFSLQERLHLSEYNIEFIPETQYVIAGKLSIVHGHHLVKGIIAPVNAARGVYLRAKKSTLIGHVHVESSHTETDLHREIITCWSTGCMCTLSPDYQPMGGKACHGFAYIETQANGDFNVKNFRIDKGKLL